MNSATGVAMIVAILDVVVAADAWPVARLASHELLPSITPWPSSPPCPPVGLGITGDPNVFGPGIVGVVGVTVAPPADFRLLITLPQKLL